MALMRLSKPDYHLGFQAEVPKALKVVPSSFGRGLLMRMWSCMACGGVERGRCMGGGGGGGREELELRIGGMDDVC